MLSLCASNLRAHLFSFSLMSCKSIEKKVAFAES